MQRRWTAHTSAAGLILRAQCKSSRRELERRLLADDPCWNRQMTFTLEKAWNKQHFRRGLAIRAVKLVG